jgi:L-amino acid N-acyltransferase YncA
MDFKYEKPKEEDRKPVTDIFNYYVEKSYAAYPDTKIEYSTFDKMLANPDGNPYTIIKTNSGEVVGYAFFKSHMPVSTMKRTVEITYFIKPGYTGKGIGKHVLHLLIEEAKKRGIDTILANISSFNEGSIRFHLKNGFVECGRFRAVGKKFGNDFDIIWMERKI